MLLNKEILTGLYGGGKTNINFNIGWSTNFVTITAYDTLSTENYRPRINTWRSDDTNIFPLSAGYRVFDFNTKTFSFPWGDRSNESTLITIPVKTTQTAGVDLYVDDRSPAPFLVPNISQWTVTNTANPNERKYRYSINRTSNKTQTISAVLFESGFWTFNYTSNSSLNNFNVVTNTPSSLTIFWGDYTRDVVSSGALVSHSYMV